MELVPNESRRIVLIGLSGVLGVVSRGSGFSFQEFGV